MILMFQKKNAIFRKQVISVKTCLRALRENVASFFSLDQLETKIRASRASKNQQKTCGEASQIFPLDHSILYICFLFVLYVRTC